MELYLQILVVYAERLRKHPFAALFYFITILFNV